jgi:hypothetical protein
MAGAFLLRRSHALPPVFRFGLRSFAVETAVLLQLRQTAVSRFPGKPEKPALTGTNPGFFRSAADRSFCGRENSGFTSSFFFSINMRK